MLNSLFMAMATLYLKWGFIKTVQIKLKNWITERNREGMKSERYKRRKKRGSVKE